MDQKGEDYHRDAVFAEGGHHQHEDELHDIKFVYPGIYYEKCNLYRHDSRTIAKSWMVRDERYKYVYCPDVHDELYDLRSDPQERLNLIGGETYLPVIARLKDRLLKWFSDTVDQVPEAEDSRQFP